MYDFIKIIPYKRAEKFSAPNIKEEEFQWEEK